MTTTKTYDRHTGKFLAKVAENMPEMTSYVMQGWIENPVSLQRFLAGLWTPNHIWREQNSSIIHLSIISDGTTGPQWIERLEEKGSELTKCAKELLTSGVIHEIVILKGSIFDDSDRVTIKILGEATRGKLMEPNPEIACLIREMLSDAEIEDMGLLWIVVMHDAIKDSNSHPNLLFIDPHHGSRYLGTHYSIARSKWNSGGGFAFVASQMPAK